MTEPIPGKGPAGERYYGCGSNSCALERPRGMGTNGRCQCAEGIADARERRRVSLGIQRLAYRCSELRAALRELARAVDEGDQEGARHAAARAREVLSRS